MVEDIALTDDEDESTLLGAGLVGAAEAYVTSATSGGIANNIARIIRLEGRCVYRRKGAV